MGNMTVYISQHFLNVFDVKDLLCTIIVAK